jgi:Kef-type K+ transport system membrane component KefB
MLNLGLLVLQMTVVLIACRLVGGLFLKIRQPRVNGEMFAGILLGPSLLGMITPRGSAYLFPSSSLEFLNALGQIGVVVFIFLAGLELDPAELKSQARAAASTSLVSILAPFLLAYPLSLYLYPRVASGDVSFLNFTLFMGAATSITAFPMLARILAERNILTSRLGTVAVTCAATAGVATWCMLSYVVLLIKGVQGRSGIWWTVAGIAAFFLLMVYALKPLLRRFGDLYNTQGSLSDRSMALMTIIVLGAGVCTGYLGLHPLFGAFLVGVLMPKHHAFTRYVAGRLETVTVSVLLPLYFAFSGLRTNIGMMRGLRLWEICAVIILFAIIGKILAPMLSAWASGMSLRESAGLGALLNTRGLIALVVFNIGLDLKVISVALFSMLVVMALVNTLLTTWLLDLFCPKKFFETITASRGVQLAAPPVAKLGARVSIG